MTASLPLPSVEDYVNSVQSRAMPEMLGLATACLTVVGALMLIRSLRGGK